MSATVVDVSEAEDPLGRRRCVRCFYDRRGLQPDAPCPECGRVPPTGVTVFTLERPRVDPLRTIMVQAGCALMLVVVVAVCRVNVRYFAITLLPTLVLVVVSLCRRAWSPDAFVGQIWITADGIGLDADADRQSPLGRFTRTVSIVLGGLPFGLIFGTDAISGRFSLVQFGIYFAVGFAGDELAEAMLRATLTDAWERGRAHPAGTPV